MQTKYFFENTETAFALKTDAELERAYLLFKMIAREPLVKIGTAATKLALKLNLPVEGLIRTTVFDHFCGGTTEEDCLPVVDKLFEKGVASVLDYSVEGKAKEMSFDIATDKVMQIIDFAATQPSMPFAVFKPTGFGRFEVWRKVTEGETLTDTERVEWDNIVRRFEQVCEQASQAGISLLIDAEESWMQTAADDLVLEMMRRYNRERVVVFNTLQCYRHDRLEYLQKIHKTAMEENFLLGFKIVRGAYMEKENKRAADKGYPSPICKDKEATDANFNTVMHYIFDNLNFIRLFIGSHNEHSNYLALELMEAREIERNDDRVWFGQLYGMSDHISFNLARRGYNVTKYLPFGPVKDVMPYLMRRAEENTSVAGQTNRELDLLKREKERRGI